MKIIPTELPGALIIEPHVFRDERGFFLETYQKLRFKEHGIDVEFVQDNHSRSMRGTIRGLHAQLNHQQGKLIRVVEGEIYDVIVDLRRHSSHFGRWIGVWLSADNFRQLFIPPGFAHGFCVTSDVAQVVYKCTDYYNAADEISILWNDRDLDINWPAEIASNPVISAKDRAAKTLREAFGQNFLIPTFYVDKEF